MTNATGRRLFDIGIVGAGVMGANLARNLGRNGHSVVLQDLDGTKVEEFLTAHGEEGVFSGTTSLAGLVGSLSVPKKVLVMVPAGRPTDAVLDGLAGLLGPGDIVIDGGNAHFADTRRRTELFGDKGVHFVGTGISGGEEGALNGPSLMPGGSAEAYRHVGPLLESIAAKVDGAPCCCHVGPDGAGHFVKMVHNGIEYADMQLIAEAYQLLRDVAGFSMPEIAGLFTQWNTEELESYLVEITADIVRHTDPLTGAPFLDIISDAAEQLGTGRWTAQEALELGVPVGSISEAVFARSLSERVALRQSMRAPGGTAPLNADERAMFADQVRRALYGAKIVAYAQGFDLIRQASEHYRWQIDLAALALIWRNGCIIRARLLDDVRRAYLEMPEIESLLVDDHFANVLDAADEAWREVVVTATRNRVAAPAFASALNHLDALKAERLPTTVVQAQRDYMGAHLYRRVDRPGVFHTRWNGDHAEVEVG